MSLARVKNIWTADLSELSNRDRASVYFERAKVVVARGLADPAEIDFAIYGKKFSRCYLVLRIGSSASVTHQNPRIKALLKTADRHIQTRCESSNRLTQGTSHEHQRPD